MWGSHGLRPDRDRRRDRRHECDESGPRARRKDRHRRRGKLGRNYSTDKFVIATGSKPARPPIPGAEHGITSDELIHLKQQPARMVVVGGGFIGLEFGFALAWAGTKVTILQSGPEIAPALDHD